MSDEKKKKRSEVEGREKPDRRREGGGDEVGDRGSLCMNIKGVSPSPFARHVISAVSSA